MKDQGAILPSTRISCKASCDELHYGICITRDAAIYQRCLTIATKIEQFFTKGLCGQFHRVCGKDKKGCVVFLVFVYLAHVRMRSSGARISHVFCKAHLCGKVSRYELSRVSGIKTFLWMGASATPRTLSHSDTSVCAHIYCKHFTQSPGQAPERLDFHSLSILRSWATLWERWGPNGCFCCIAAP